MQKKKAPAEERAVSDEKITPIDAEKPAAFQPKYAEGYTFSLLSATGYGLSPVLVRVGLENQGIGVSLAGGLVAYIAATAAFALLVLLWPGQWRHVLAVDREAAKWFTFSGFLVFFSQMFLYMAMSVAPVTVVSPINRLSILFRLFFSRLLNPQHEVFGGSVILATVVSMLGAVAADAQHRRRAVAAAAAGKRGDDAELALALSVWPDLTLIRRREAPLEPWPPIFDASLRSAPQETADRDQYPAASEPRVRGSAAPT